MARILGVLRLGADAMAAGMLAAIFVVFLVQIIGRYVLGLSLGWTIELCLTLWLWVVFWGSAFCLRPSDHVRFDILYLSVSRPVQRVFSAVAALAIIIVFVVSYFPTLDYVDFYKIKKSSTLRIPLNYVFSVYMIFMTMIILRYSRVLIDFLRGKADVEGPITSYELIDTESAR
jgi:C4-dicarboxylate transporter, DctQ subunit